MEETLQALHGNSYFTTLELLSGFWQIALAVKDRLKSAFVSRVHFHFKVMPFDLTNALATFQKLMNRVLLGLNWRICIVYLDDIVEFGKKQKDHNVN